MKERIDEFSSDTEGGVTRRGDNVLEDSSRRMALLCLDLSSFFLSSPVFVVLLLAVADAVGCLV